MYPSTPRYLNFHMTFKFRRPQPLFPMPAMPHRHYLRRFGRR